MRLFRKQQKASRTVIAGLRTVFACCLFVLTVLQGLTFCFCAADPDDCGAPCHECGSVPQSPSILSEHSCDHLTFAGLPSGETPLSGLEALVHLFAVTVPRQIGVRVPDRQQVSAPERPPDVLHPQLRFIACSAQILC